MRYHTKEYYTLMMSLGTVDMYSPIPDREYGEEDMEELYAKALDDYIEEERADHDAPPELELYSDELQMELAAMFEKRPAFDEDEAAAEFEELYNDNLEEPDEDLPEWVRSEVDARILAMYLMPEKIYEKLSAEDAENEERFDALDDAADEALEKIAESLPENYRRFIEVLEDCEDCCVTAAVTGGGELRIEFADWDTGDEEVRALVFTDAEPAEDDGISVTTSIDDDGDVDSDCELLFSELYMEGGRPEVHMLFDNNGLKYLTFGCASAKALDENGAMVAAIEG